MPLYRVHMIVFFASIPVYDGSDTKEFWSWLHRIESACSYTNRNLDWRQWVKVWERY